MTDPRKTSDGGAAQEKALQNAVRSMHGHAAFALLGDIVDSARQSFGFVGSVDDAMAVLSGMSGVRVEAAEPPERSRVFSSR